MGVSGTLEYFSDLVSFRKRKKKKQLNTVSVKIRMDCEGCALKVKNALSGVKGAKSVDVNLKEQKATVYGFVEAKKVLAAAQATGKKVEPWPYVPYNMIAHPYVTGVYDKKAPPNFVRGTDDPAIATLDPGGGHGKLYSGWLSAWRKIRESLALPSQPTTTNVNVISNAHAAIIFCDTPPFRLRMEP